MTMPTQLRWSVPVETAGTLVTCTILRRFARLSMNWKVTERSKALVLGPKGMAVVPPQMAGCLLDELLPHGDVEAMTARQFHEQASAHRDPAAAREVAQKLAERQPYHPVTQLLRAIQAADDGHVGAGLVQLRELMQRYPASAPVRARLLSCCRALCDTALMRKTLGDVVDRGILTWNPIATGLALPSERLCQRICRSVTHVRRDARSRPLSSIWRYPPREFVGAGLAYLGRSLLAKCAISTGPCSPTESRPFFPTATNIMREPTATLSVMPAGGTRGCAGWKIAARSFGRSERMRSQRGSPGSAPWRIGDSRRMLYTLPRRH